MNITHLSAQKIDVLKEIGNIGAGNATTAMGKMVRGKIDMKVPKVHLLSIHELVDKIGGPEREVAAVISKINGDITGTIYFVLTIAEAEWIFNQVKLQEDIPFTQDGAIQEYAASALTEIANILTGSYLSSLADFASLDLSPSVPHLSVDMAGATLVTGLVEIAGISDYAFVIDTIFSASNQSGVQGHFLLMPDDTSMPVLWHALGVQDE